MKDRNIDRRTFLRSIGALGAGSLVAVTPWLSHKAVGAAIKTDRCRIGVIGVGSRGCFHLSLLSNIPAATVTAICDTYPPSIEEALKIVPHAKVYGDYRRMLEDREVDAVVIATPPTLHCRITCDAFDAGKDVLCEKWMKPTGCTRPTGIRGEYFFQGSKGSLILAIARRWI